MYTALLPGEGWGEGHWGYNTVLSTGPPTQQQQPHHPPGGGCKESVDSSIEALVYAMAMAAVFEREDGGLRHTARQPEGLRRKGPSSKEPAVGGLSSAGADHRAEQVSSASARLMSRNPDPDAAAAAPPN